MSTELVQPKEMTKYRSDIGTIQTAAKELSIQNAEDVTKAEGLLKMVHEGEKAITSRKEEITRPLMAALASGRDLFKPLEFGFADAKKTIKGKLLAYQIAEDEKEEARQAKLVARVEKGTMGASTAAVKMASEAPKSRANTRVVKKLVIIDETLLPREYLVPERTLITKALMEGTEVPGAKLIEEKIIAVR